MQLIASVLSLFCFGTLAQASVHEITDNNYVIVSAKTPEDHLYLSSVLGDESNRTDPRSLMLPDGTHMVVAEGKLNDQGEKQTSAFLPGYRQYYQVFVIDGVAQVYDMHSTGLFFVLKNIKTIFFDNAAYDIGWFQLKKLSSEEAPFHWESCCGHAYKVVAACPVQVGTAQNDIFDIDVASPSQPRIFYGRGGIDTAVLRVPFQQPGQVVTKVKIPVAMVQYVHGNGNIYFFKDIRYVVFGGGEDITEVRPAEAGKRARLQRICHYHGAIEEECISSEGCMALAAGHQ